MNYPNRFSWNQIPPDENEIEEWAQTYFYNTMNMLNSFFVHLDLAETVSRFEAIDMELLIKEQLEQESPETVAIAVARIKELYTSELEFMKAYSTK